MKINRVILACNNNSLYYDFWNPLSKVYKEKFGIIPTLIFLGTVDELKKCNISDEYGEVVLLAPNPKYPTASQCTLALFWYTQFYEDEVCFINGIDQVPLSGLFIKDLIKDISEEAYVMMIADACNPDWTDEKGVSPSSYHIAKGKKFKEIFSFQDNFINDVDKIYNSGILEEYLNHNPSGYQSEFYKWGIDETYFSYKLRNYKGDIKIESLQKFKLLSERRIECYRSFETPYDFLKLKNGWYSEAHLCRPFANHTNYILTMFNNINFYLD